MPYTCLSHEGFLSGASLLFLGIDAYQISKFYFEDATKSYSKIDKEYFKM